jgi:hypothetical protein
VRAAWFLVAAVFALLTGSAVGAAAPVAGPQLIAVELQPEDPSVGGQFAVVANRTAVTLNLGCWRLRSSLATMTIAPPLRLRPGAVALLSPDRDWLRAVDHVQLVDPVGRRRTVTPELADRASDDRVWFRGATGSWHFGRTSFGKGVAAGQLLARASSRCRTVY